MNAKDKEKLKIMKGFLPNTNETIVIDPDDYSEKANTKNKEFYEGIADDADKPEAVAPGNDPEECDDFSAEENMSCDISVQLAFMAEERFEEMVDEISFDTAKRLVRRIENAEPKTAIRMLQSMFLTYGMTDMADALDILNICADYDKDAYTLFVDALFDSDIFDWFSIECMLDECESEELDDTRPWKR